MKKAERGNFMRPFIIGIGLILLLTAAGGFKSLSGLSYQTFHKSRLRASNELSEAYRQHIDSEINVTLENLAVIDEGISQRPIIETVDRLYNQTKKINNTWYLNSNDEINIKVKMIKMNVLLNSKLNELDLVKEFAIIINDIENKEDFKERVDAAIENKDVDEDIMRNTLCIEDTCREFATVPRNNAPNTLVQDYIDNNDATLETGPFKGDEGLLNAFGGHNPGEFAWFADRAEIGAQVRVYDQDGKEYKYQMVEYAFHHLKDDDGKLYTASNPKFKTAFSKTEGNPLPYRNHQTAKNYGFKTDGILISYCVNEDGTLQKNWYAKRIKT